MSDGTRKTDEDRLIYQLTIHRDLVGWVIIKLAQSGIRSQRTTGNNPKGDILIINSNDASRVKEIISSIHNQYNAVNPNELQFTLDRTSTNQPHIEIKTTYLFGKAINEIIDTGTVIAVVSAEKISQPGKAKFFQAGIVYAENIPLSQFMDVESQE
ncbi:hypothetical protein BCD67_09500 [Oscillatoriales cyanobacterium USR001]|nr:hypothetical protein BCD67_09500 [Oscillatoriales cyanobacterium USR001]